MPAADPRPASAPDVSSLRIHREAVEKPRRPMGPWIIAGIVVVLLLALTLGYLKFSASLRPLEVTTARVLAPDVGGGSASVLTASGYIVARRKAGVGPKVAGLLEYLGVEEGSQVKEGQIIGRLQANDVRAQAEAARSALEEARANLIEAQATLDQYRKEFARSQKLVAEGVVSQAEFDIAQSKLSAQEARVHSQQSAITTAEARVRQADVAIEDTNVRAPFSGTVLTKDAEEGETVAPAAAGRATSRGSVVTMADLASLEVEVDVNEGYIARLKSGQPARIVADSFPDRVYQGLIRQVIPTADRQKATVQVKVSIIEPGDLLRPDMGAKVTFLEPTDAAPAAAHPLPRVTTRAIVTGQDGIRRVWIVDGATAHPARVDIAKEADGIAEIRSGLSGGETVVTDPPPELAEGKKIRPRA